MLTGLHSLPSALSGSVFFGLPEENPSDLCRAGTRLSGVILLGTGAAAHLPQEELHVPEPLERLCALEGPLRIVASSAVVPQVNDVDAVCFPSPSSKAEQGEILSITVRRHRRRQDIPVSPRLWFLP